MKKQRNVNVLSLLCAVVFVFFLSICSFNILFPLKFKATIKSVSEKENVSPVLVASIIKNESNFNSSAVSSSGAIGLMQVLPATGKWVYEKYFGENFHESLLLDGEMNIKIGVKYLAYLFEKYGDETYVLACYNAGEGVVKSWTSEENVLEKTQIRFEETKKYVQNVQNVKKIYKIRLI